MLIFDLITATRHLPNVFLSTFKQKFWNFSVISATYQNKKLFVKKSIFHCNYPSSFLCTAAVRCLGRYRYEAGGLAKGECGLRIVSVINVNEDLGKWTVRLDCRDGGAKDATLLP